MLSLKETLIVKWMNTIYRHIVLFYYIPELILIIYTIVETQNDGWRCYNRVSNDTESAKRGTYDGLKLLLMKNRTLIRR